MSAFVLKIIALAAMLVDHVGAVFPNHTSLYFRVVGRLTFPIFVYLIAEGFRHTRNGKKYLLRLFIFAIIAEFPFDWAIMRAQNIRRGHSPWHVDLLNNTNIFYTLFLGGMAIFAFQLLSKALSEHVAPHITSWLTSKLGKYSPITGNLIGAMSFAIIVISALPTLGFMWIAEFLSTDYGGYGVLFILLMYVIKPKWLMLIVFAIMNVFQHRALFPLIQQRVDMHLAFYLFIPATLLTVPLIALYNGKRGPSLKWFFYVAYPAHLMVLAILAHFIL